MFPAAGPIVRTADFQSADGLHVRFNGENAGKLFIQNYAMGAEFIGSGEKKEDFAGGKLEMTTWLNAIRNDTDVVVKPEQAYAVTRVLEAIYQSAASGQLVGVILVLARLLAHPVEPLAQLVTSGQQLLALLGIGGHGVQRVLQHQTRLAQLLLLQLALLGGLALLFVQTATAQRQLLGLGLAGGKPGLQLALTT